MSGVQPLDVDVTDEFNRMLDERGHGAASALARALGVRPQTVSKWSTGETTLPPARWVQVAVALDEPDPLRLVRRSTVLEQIPGFEGRLLAGTPADADRLWRETFGSPPNRRVSRRRYPDLAVDGYTIEAKTPGGRAALRELLATATDDELDALELVAADMLAARSAPGHASDRL